MNQIIIIEKEWLEILDDQSPEFLAKIMSAVYAHFLHDTEPDGFTQAERIAYEFILKNIMRYQQHYDLEAGYEASIKRRRAELTRKRRAEEKQSQMAPERNDPKMVRPVKNCQNYKFRPLPADSELNMRRNSTDDHYYPAFLQFYQSYDGPKDDCDIEFARFKHQYPENISIADLLDRRLTNRRQWARDMAKLGLRTPPLPPMAEYISHQCWNDRLPRL